MGCDCVGVEWDGEDVDDIVGVVLDVGYDIEGGVGIGVVVDARVGGVDGEDGVVVGEFYECVSVCVYWGMVDWG